MQNENLKPNEIGIFALGGLGEIGKNMYCVEYANELIIIDSGILFPDDNLMGIDYVIPDYTYLIDNQVKIKGLFITHGHEDHIGGIPFLLKQVKIPMIYANGLALGIIKKKMEEYPELKVKYHEFTENETVRFDKMEVNFFRTNHSIPDSFGIAIDTPQGTIVHTGDFKFDFTPTSNDANYAKMAWIGDKGVLCLLSDSTNAELDDFTESEKEVSATIHDLFKSIAGRVIIATFSSNVHRIQQIVEASIQTNRKIAVFGRSMEKTIEVGSALGYIHAPDGTFLYSRNMTGISRKNLTILCTGSQGEPMAALSRIASGTHKQIALIPGDTIILSSSPIPGNQESVNKTINLLYKNGASVITKSPFADVHASGHGGKNELKLMLKLMKPKYFMPIHGEYRMLKTHAALAIDCGVHANNVYVLDNGQILALSKDSGRMAGKVPTSDVYVDGLAIGEIGSQVIKDRRELSKDGLLSVIMTINQDRHEVICTPTIISRGFIFMKDNEQMIKTLQTLALDVTDHYLEIGKKININGIKNDLVKSLGKYIFEKTNREPMITPVIMVL
ncbi:MAG: ribonuclease J [Candidatus Izemoplasmatales bacterium]|nr:ribonuclease J [Candidatus Izemoplasmatales bacterium]MDD3865284.1 ribonuclease J [Candidatus Izemoplasmatales bacterium]